MNEVSLGMWALILLVGVPIVVWLASVAYFAAKRHHINNLVQKAKDYHNGI